MRVIRLSSPALARGAGSVLVRWRQPVGHISPTACHAICRMGFELVHLQLRSSISDVSFRGGGKGRAGCPPGGSGGFREKHAMRCDAGAGLAAAVGRIRPSRSASLLAATDTPAGRTQGRFYPASREIAAVLE